MLPHRIDCHVLTLPESSREWANLLRSDLDREPVNQYWQPGIAGDVGSARAAAFAQGRAQYMTFADPDDRVVLGAMAMCASWLDAHPDAGASYTMEQEIDAAGRVIHGRPCYRLVDWRSTGRPRHMPGLVMLRREVAAPVLGTIRGVKIGEVHALCCAIAASGHPILHVPVIGRQWRRHDKSLSAEHRRGLQPAR